MAQSRYYILIIATAALSIITACSNSYQKGKQNESKASLPSDAIKIEYQHHIYCKVMLQGSIPARMIFDTGCPSLLLDSTFYADTFGKNRNLRRAIVGGTGDGKELIDVNANNWHYSIGKESKAEDMAMVVNLRRIVGDGADGMFGMSFMQDKRVEFNYADGWMRFLPTDGKISEDFTRIQCRWINGKNSIIIPLSIQFEDGYVFKGDFLIDTGMTGTLSLNSTTAERLKSQQHLAHARCMTYTIGGIGGSRKDYIFKSPQITIGNDTIKEVRVTWAGNQQGSLADTRYDGLIGNEILDRFDVIFDFVDCVIYLRPNKNFNRAEPNDLGIAITPNADHWIVNGLLEGGNAEKSGLRRGDRIEAINGIKANDSNVADLYPLPDEITLTIRRNNTLENITIHKE